MAVPAHRDKAYDLTMKMIAEGRLNGYDNADLAEYVDGSEHSIRHYGGGDALPSLPVFLGLFRRIKSISILRSLARECGPHVICVDHIPKPPAEVSGTSQIMTHFAAAAHKAAAVVDEVSKGLTDVKSPNEIDADEACKIRKATMEAARAYLALGMAAARIEEGE